MRYVRGRDFDARHEFETALQPDMRSRHTEAYARLLDFLVEFDTDGFRSARRDWTEAGVNNIWVYSDGPLRCAIQVLSNGGMEEDQVTLLATVFVEGHAELVIWLGDFVTIADQRLKEGEVVVWV